MTKRGNNFGLTGNNLIVVFAVIAALFAIYLMFFSTPVSSSSRSSFKSHFGAVGSSNSIPKTDEFIPQALIPNANIFTWIMINGNQSGGGSSGIIINSLTSNVANLINTIIQKFPSTFNSSGEPAPYTPAQLNGITDVFIRNAGITNPSLISSFKAAVNNPNLIARTTTFTTQMVRNAETFVKAVINYYNSAGMGYDANNVNYKIDAMLNSLIIVMDIANTQGIPGQDILNLINSFMKLKQDGPGGMGPGMQGGMGPGMGGGMGPGMQGGMGPGMGGSSGKTS